MENHLDAALYTVEDGDLVFVVSRAQSSGLPLLRAASEDQSGRWLVGADRNVLNALAWPARRLLPPIVR